MYKLAIICPEKLSKGFELTGVKVFTSDSSDRTKDLLFETIEGKQTGLIVLPQEHLESFEERTLKALEKLDFPLIVPIPMIKESEGKPEAYVAQMVRRAIGYEIKL